MPAPAGNRHRAELAENRDQMIRFRCTADERARVTAAAEKRGLTVSDLLRDMLREKKVLPKVDG